jgi:hypothetical protein
MSIKEILTKHFASSEIGVYFEVNNIFFDESHPQRPALLEFMKSASDEEIQKILENKKYQFLGKESPNISWEENASLIYCRKVFPKEVGKLRLETLLNKELNPPPPYDDSVFSSFERDSNDLISFNEYKDRNKKGQLDNKIFKILLSLPHASNSMYWAMASLVEISMKTNIKIRLDPYLIFDKSNYRQMFYKMLVYGKPPDLKALNTLNEIKHIRWMPDDIDSSDVSFTDAVWSPRGNEIHFISEEVPKINSAWFRGSRYFHAVYNCSNNKIIHLDGAIRIYSNNEIEVRNNCHVKDIGKIGKRVKIFQIDSELELKDWSNIASSFFVWNEDLQNYFS